MAAIIWMDEVWEPSSDEVTYDDDFRRRGITGDQIQERQHTRIFQVEVDDHNTTPDAVRTLALSYTGGPYVDPITGLPAALPSTHALHPTDTIAKVVSHRVTRSKDSAHVFLIIVTYKTRPKPIDEPATLNWSDGSVEWVFEGAEAFVDTAGVEHAPTEAPYPGLPAGSLYPITISTRQVPDPPPVDQEHYRILTVRKNFNTRTCPTGTGTGTGSGGHFAAVNPTIGWEPYLVDRYYSRRINSTPFIVPNVCYPYPIGTVFLAEFPRADFEFRNGIYYWATTWVFWIRARGWYLRFPDLGFDRFVVPGVPDKGLTQIRLRNGELAQNPQRLDGAGSPLAVGAPPVYRSFRVRKYADFNALNLFI